MDVELLGLKFNLNKYDLADGRASQSLVISSAEVRLTYSRVGTLLFLSPSSVVGTGGERGGRSMCDEMCR